MYLSANRTYYRGGDQCASRAPFLLLIQPKQATIGETCAAANTYAIVRKVALHQIGHWMMGTANIGGRYRSVSGAYGNDGLPMDVDTLPADAVPLPQALYDAWATGGGHNGAGSEGKAMREWARETFKERL